MKIAFAALLLCCTVWVHAALVQVMVSPNQKNWEAKNLGETTTFTVSIYRYGNLVEDASISYEIGPELFPEKKGELVLKKGQTTLKAALKEPGFLRCKVTARVDGQSYTGMATVAYGKEQLKPFSQDPADFDAFWKGAMDEARKIPLDTRMTLIPERCTATLNAYHVSYQNERYGSRMYGILMVPKKEGKYPALLLVPGAGIRPYGGAAYGDDVITLQVGIHGIPVNMPQQVYDDLNAGALRDYPFFNLNDRNRYYYKRVYTGCTKGIDLIYSLPQFDGKTVGVTGGSQGGALSIITTALDSRIRFLAAFYPALCDQTAYAHKRAPGWPMQYLARPLTEAESATTGYYDVSNFARRVQVPMFLGFGYNDDVCSPSSVQATLNIIPSAEKDVHVFQDTGHWTYPEENNAAWKWLQKKLHAK